MIQNNDVNILKSLNKDLKKYKIKLKFQYYEVCPFNENKLEIMHIILKNVDYLKVIIIKFLF